MKLGSLECRPQWWLLVLLLYSGLSLNSCQKQVMVKYDGVMIPLEQAAEKQYLKAKGHQQARRWKKAIRAYQALLQRFPTSSRIDDAYYESARVYLRQKRIDDAERSLKAIIEKYPTSVYILQTRFYYGMLLQQQNRLDESRLFLEAIPVDRLKDETMQVRLLEMLRTIYAKQDDTLSLFWVSYEIYQRQGDREDIRSLLLSLIGEMERKDLESIAGKLTSQFPAGHVLMRLARNGFTEGRFREARSYLREFLRRYRNRGLPHESTSDAEKMSRRLQNLDKTEPYRLGVLLPLSGPYEKTGRAVLNTILLASNLMRSSASGSPLELIVRDTHGDPDHTMAMLDEVVLDYQVVGVIGPMLKKTSSVAANRANLFGVPLMSMTQDEGIADIGEFVFQNGLSKSDQVRALAQFTVRTLGARRIALLYPEHSYGKEMTLLMWDELKKYSEVQVTGLESYERSQTDFGSQVRSLVGLFYIEPRRHELCPDDKKAKTIKKKQELPCFKREELPAIVDFEVVFIPDSYDKVKQVAPSLAYYGVRGVQLLGGNLWHHPELIDRSSANTLRGAVFVDGFFARSKEPSVREFVTRYKKEFKGKPDILTAQAFDTMRIFSNALMVAGVKSRKGLRDYILSMEPIEGASGRLSFLRNGKAKRHLYHFMVDRGKMRPLELE